MTQPTQQLETSEIFGDALNDIAATIFSFLTVEEDFIDGETRTELRKDLQRFADALSRARQAKQAPTPSLKSLYGLLTIWEHTAIALSNSGRPVLQMAAEQLREKLVAIEAEASALGTKEEA